MSLDELSAKIDADIDAQRKANEVNLTGGTTGAETTALENKASEEPTVELLKRSFRSVNAAAGIYEWGQRKLTSTDPTFNVADHLDELKQGVPAQYLTQFNTTGSLEEARLLRSQILQEVDDANILGHAGARGFATSALAGIVDIDAPLMLASDGTYTGAKLAATAEKLGIQGTRLSNIVRGAGAGLEAGAVTQTGNVLSRPTGDWTDIPNAALGGLVFGSVLGTLGKTGDKVSEDANAAASKLREDFADSVNAGQAGRTDYSTRVQDDGLFNKFNEDSVGAASVGKKQFNPDMVSDNVASMRKEAQDFLAENGVSAQFETNFPNSVTGQAARKFYDAISETPLASDWDKMMKSNSAIAQALAYKAFESPAGIVRNNKSAALLNNMYWTEIAAPVTTKYSDAFTEWLRTNHPEVNPIVGRNTSGLLNDFNNELLTELQYRYHDGLGNPNTHAAVKRLADAVDEASSKATQILKGHDGETSVRGSENLKPQSGWFRQLWRGDKISSLIKDNGVPKSAIENALSNSYKRIHGWDDDVASLYAKAVVRRSLAKETGIDTNVLNILSEEGRDYMEQFLKDNGFSKEKAASLIDSLKGVSKEKSQENILKSRADVDLREQIPGTKYKLMDMVDNDVLRVWNSYSRSAAGASALARHGIQKADKRDIINAIKSEEEANGGRKLSDDFLDGVFSYFDGGAFSGGLNPWVRRALQTTNLALLNGLGLTQMAEMGVQIGSVGIDAFLKTAPKEVRDFLNGKNIPALEEMKGLISAIDGEHNIHMDWMALDHMNADPGHFHELGAWLDKLLIKGGRLQGYTSGFYKINQLQQRIAVRSMLYKLAEHFQGRKTISAERLYDIGLTNDKLINRIGKYFTNGTVEFDSEGTVLKLNTDKWKPSDLYDLGAILNRHVGQVIQKAQRGEGSVWMNKDVGALLSHLKQFTMLSMQKQLLRNARIADPEATMSFIYSMMTAAAIYMAQQTLSGKTDNLTPGKISRGAISMANMTGFLPQWSDPIMSMLGMDNLRFSPYSQGAGSDVFGAPPAFSTLNRIAHIPGALPRVLTGQYKNSDIYALQATPIVGNAYGLSYIFNSMKDDTHAKKSAPTE